MKCDGCFHTVISVHLICGEDCIVVRPEDDVHLLVCVCVCVRERERECERERESACVYAL